MSVPYEPSKWRIVYGSAEGTEGFALSELCGRISQELCQNIACVSAANFVRECENQSIVLMGTLKNNPLLKSSCTHIRYIGCPLIQECTFLP